MQIKILIENEGTAPFVGEHGLAMYIRHEGTEILLDAGMTGDFLQNCALLDCPVEGVDTAVLSHGHFDHADGFPALFERNSAVKVFARPAVMEPQYAADGRYIGLCAPLLHEYADRFVLSDECREIAPGLWLVPDDVDHEQSLVAETEGGLVVMNCCCHAGPDKIVADILDRFPGKKVRALVGGLHLMGPGGVTTLGPTPEAVRALARRLTAELGVDGVYTGHCTGGPAFALLSEAAPGKIHAIHPGDTLEF